MTHVRRRIIGLMMGLVWLAAWALPGLAQTSSVTHSPAKVVEKYFTLDNKGVRLDAASFESVAGYVDWKEEPAWGKVIVIHGFTVPDDFRQWEIVNRLEVIVPVEFHVLGVMYLDTAGFVPEPGAEQARVRLKVKNGRWRIVEPILPPHVGQKRMLNFVRQAMLEEKDGTRQASLAALQEELRKAKE
ncbi:hypothetical protein [Nitrospira defluvii]|uniref:SnoaL-like domain-containing protein n=1 Tax=Nitrospira defluvii TaxID=330214 RepID=A0ABM8QT29_9BACT|nr:hypothetical protein [Nitrospira defluvii]CAE6713851.1 conserved hypothetical protein [Nitrospira defluvii]